MRIVTHQQIEGVEPGETITVDAERGQWLIDNGYASKAESKAEAKAEGKATKPSKGETADAESTPER